MPEDLKDGYGFPDMTELDKRRILGENFAKLFDVPIPAESLTA
jgi:hypothetical protein